MKLASAAAITSVGLSQRGLPVAPHVAGALSDLGAVDDDDLTALIHALTPDQLAGMTVLPDPLPVPPGATGRRLREFDSLTGAERHLLTFVAVSSTDRVDTILTASTADPALLVRGAAADALRISDGTVRFRDPADRSVLVRDVGAEVVRAANWSLSRAFREFGEPGHAAWHARLGARVPEDGTLRELRRFGRKLLASGSAHGAYRVGRLLRRDGATADQEAGALLAGQAALALGALRDAASILTPILDCGDPGIRTGARAAHSAAVGLLEGVDPDAHDPIAEVIAQTRIIDSATTTTSDRSALASIREIVQLRATDREEVARIHARLLLSVQTSRPSRPWSTVPGPLSPLIDAHVRQQHVEFLSHSGDLARAARVQRDSLLRLPMTHLTGGSAAATVRSLGDVAPELTAAFAQSLSLIAPRRPAPVALTRGLFGEDVVHRSAAFRLRDEPATVSRKIDLLTTREREVSERVARGDRNRDIAVRLGISERTVEVHISRIFRKLAVRSRTGLVAVLLGDRSEPHV